MKTEIIESEKRASSYRRSPPTKPSSSVLSNIGKAMQKPILTIVMLTTMVGLATKVRFEAYLKMQIRILSPWEILL